MGCQHDSFGWHNCFAGAWHGSSNAEHMGLGALLVGVWSSGKAELPIQLIEKANEVGSQTGRFPGGKAP